MKQKHTKLPWRAEGAGIKSDAATVVLTSGRTVSFRVATCKDGDVETVKANAEFIVKAVNCHDELLAALVAIHHEARREFAMYGVSDIGKQVAGAIARAEGKTK